jgi:Ca2+/Na+ antiporter
VLGCMILVCGLLIMTGEATGSAVGWIVAVAGAMATFWTLNATYRSDVRIVADHLGPDTAVSLPATMAPVHVLLPAHLATVAAALATLLGLLRLARA